MLRRKQSSIENRLNELDIKVNHSRASLSELKILVWTLTRRFSYYNSRVFDLEEHFNTPQNDQNELSQRNYSNKVFDINMLCNLSENLADIFRNKNVELVNVILNITSCVPLIRIYGTSKRMFPR